MARNSVVIDLEIRNKQARAALQGVEGGFTRLSQKTQQSTKAMSQGFNRASQSVSGNIQPVQNLTRIIEDAPFGVRGVANNINPFIESFSRMKTEAGSTSAAMKSLLTSAFTGPGAILTISALVTSSITAIQMGLFDWGDEAESTDEKMEKLMDTVDSFIEETAALSGENAFDPLGQATTQQRLEEVRGLRNELQRMFDLREEAAQMRNIIQSISAGQGDASTQIQQLHQINDSIAEQEALFGDLSKAEEEAVQKKIDDLEATENLNQAFIRLNPALSLQQSLNERMRPVLRDLELGLSGAESEVRNLRDAYQQNMEMLREQIESGDVQGDQLEELKELMAQYKEAVEQADKALKGLSDNQKQAPFVFKPFTDEIQRLLDTMQRMEEFSQTGLGGSLLDPSVRATQTEGEIVEENVFTPMKKTEFEKEQEWINKIVAGYEYMGDAAEDAGESGERSLRQTTMAANMLGDALAQAIIRGEELEGVLKSLAAQLASRAIIRGLSFLLPGGAVIGETGFFSNFFAHGTDMGFPGTGIVGERGPEMLVAPPFSSIITNENIERMDRMRKEARSGAENISAMGMGGSVGAIRQAVIEGMQQARIYPQVQISRLRHELNDHDDYNDRIGN